MAKQMCVCVCVCVCVFWFSSRHISTITKRIKSSWFLYLGSSIVAKNVKDSQKFFKNFQTWSIAKFG
jgi:hypothetical protein